MPLATDYQPPVPNWLTLKLWKAAGADENILRVCPYGEQTKYACLGGIVAATGVLAGIAGAYAFYTIFAPKTSGVNDPTDPLTAVIALLAGCVWGAIIFNLDRYIVASTGKGDGTDQITSKELSNALPRIVLGLIISITISKPLEIRIFKPEIDQALFGEIQELKLDNKKRVEALFVQKIASGEQEVGRLRTEIGQQDVIYRAAEKEATDESDGRGGSGRASLGPIFQRKKALADLEKSNLDRISAANQTAIESEEQKLAALRSEQDSELKKGEGSVLGVGGLLKRMQIGHDKAGWLISLMITAVFAAIELTPIFFKLMIIRGPYDYLDEHVKEMIKARRGIHREAPFEGGGPGMHIEITRDYTAEEELATRRMTLQQQGARRRQAISAWSRKISGEIEDNPDNFVEEPAAGA